MGRVKVRVRLRVRMKVRVKVKMGYRNIPSADLGGSD